MKLTLLQSSIRILKRNQKLIFRSNSRSNNQQQQFRNQSTSTSSSSTLNSFIPALTNSSPLPTKLTASSDYGQPLPSTHPHLVKSGELTIGITAEEYELRRKTLMDSLEEGSIVIVAGGKLKYLSGQIL